VSYNKRRKIYVSKRKTSAFECSRSSNVKKRRKNLLSNAYERRFANSKNKKSRKLRQPNNQIIKNSSLSSLMTLLATINQQLSLKHRSPWSKKSYMQLLFKSLPPNGPNLRSSEKCLVSHCPRELVRLEPPLAELSLDYQCCGLNTL